MGKRYYDNYDYEEAYQKQIENLVQEVRGSRNGKVDERGVGKLPIQNIHIQKHQYREQHNIA